MRLGRGLKNVFLVVVAVALICSCSREADEGSGEKGDARKKKFVLEEGFCGWNSLTLRSTCARLDVVPELGGKIMGYDLMGYQILWHDKKTRTAGVGRSRRMARSARRRTRRRSLRVRLRRLVDYGRQPEGHRGREDGAPVQAYVLAREIQLRRESRPFHDQCG